MTSAHQNQFQNKTRVEPRKPFRIVIWLLIYTGSLAVAILLSSYFQFGEVSLEGIFSAQKNNKIFWLLAGVPFFLMFWASRAASVLTKKTEDMLMDQTQKFAAHTEMLELQMDYMNSYDALTGLTNRTFFRKVLDQALADAKANGNGLALIILDLNHFKEINDTLGHDNGDLVIKKVADRLKREIEVEDILARMAGDEFAVLLNSMDQESDIRRMAERLIEALGKPLYIAGLNLDLRVSIGAAVFPEHGLDSETILMRADMAMHAAKDEGGGFKEYEPGIDKYKPERLALMGELRQAVIRDELFLDYQPKVDTATGLIKHGEALIRWHHPQKGLLMPGVFIPLAEKTGVIKELSLWMLEKVIVQIAVWQEMGKNVKISVNLSARDLMDKDLPQKLSLLLYTHGVNPGQLMIEITETMLIINPERALNILRRFEDMGVDISIDDFGTGYSSLSFLKKMPVKEIKIDRTFVIDMLRDNNDIIIVQSAISLAHSLGLKVVAEGVESREVADRLQELDCDIMQGFYFAKPISPEEFINLLSSSRNHWDQ